MGDFVDFIWLLLDIVAVPLGIAMIVAPAKMYYFGNKNAEAEPPKNWNVTSRIIGVLFLGFGIWMLGDRFLW